MISAVSGIVLILALFLPWVGADLPAGVPGGGSLSGWESQNALDLFLFIVAVFAILPAALEMGGGNAEVPFADAGATFLLGAIGVFLTAEWMLIDFPDGAERKLGLWLALLAVIGVTVGAYQAMSEEVA